MAQEPAGGRPIIEPPLSFKAIQRGCQGTMTNLKARNHKVEGRKKAETRILISPGSLRLQDPKYLRRYGRAVSVPESATLKDRAATGPGFRLRTSFRPDPKS